jgi:tellurite resistance protein TerC
MLDIACRLRRRIRMESGVLFADLLGKPAGMGLASIGIVIALLAFDLGGRHHESRESETRESLVLSAFHVALGLAFGAWAWRQLASVPGMDHQSGFAIEGTLAMDDVFVIAMIFALFSIPRRYQHRVLFWGLFWGILGVIVLRAVMIGLGAAIVSQFSWVLYLFAVFLIATGIAMILVADRAYELASNPVQRFLRRCLNVTNELHGRRLFVRLPAPAGGRRALFVTPLVLALVMIEIADAIFAADPVPAILAITTDPFIVSTSSILAILGLGALSFALAALVHRFHDLTYALAAVLVFIGSKIFLADLLGLATFPPALSLAVTFALLAAGVVCGPARTRAQRRVPAQAAQPLS